MARTTKKTAKRQSYAEHMAREIRAAFPNGLGELPVRRTWVVALVGGGTVEVEADDELSAEDAVRARGLEPVAMSAYRK